MFYACATKFDVMENLKKVLDFWRELNKPLVSKKKTKNFSRFSVTSNLTTNA